MALYAENDVYLTFSGDLEITPNGDIKVGDAYETRRSAINFLIRTDRGEYKPDTRLGCDLGNNIGDVITDDLLLSMEHSALSNLTRFAMEREDITVNVIPLSHQELGIFVGVKGSYIANDGNLLEHSPEVLTYLFPYTEDGPTPHI